MVSQLIQVSQSVRLVGQSISPSGVSQEVRSVSQGSVRWPISSQSIKSRRSVSQSGQSVGRCQSFSRSGRSVRSQSISQVDQLVVLCKSVRSVSQSFSQGPVIGQSVSAVSQESLTVSSQLCWCGQSVSV